MTVNAEAVSGSDPIAVLVERDGLGDAILKLPFLRAIRRGYPNAPIWWISAFQTALAEDLRPYTQDLIAHVIPFARISGARAEMLPRLRALPSFSTVFDTRTRFKSVLTARSALRHGGYYFCVPGPPVGGNATWPWRRPQHVGRRALTLATAALGPIDASGELTPSDSSRQAAAALLPPDEPWIGLVIGSFRASKNWPYDRFVALAGRLREKGLKPVVLTGPEEKALAPLVAESAPFLPIIDMTELRLRAPRGPLDAPLALAASLRMVVANDSGLGHLFGAGGRPVVSLFGPTDPDRWAPMTPAGRIVRAQDFGGSEMTRIPVDAVERAVLSLLAEISARRPGA